MSDEQGIDRRRLMRWAALGGAGLALRSLPISAVPAAAERGPLLVRPIPSSGETLPLVGLGSWITFNVGDDAPALDGCAEVLRAFFAEGGRLVDSSPMYGSSQKTIGYGLRKLGYPKPLFATHKVWTSSGAEGAAQIEASRRDWGIARFDLLQVHNMLAWEEHLPRLAAMKAAGTLRYVGVTTSEGRRHAEMEKILRTQTLDFIQLSYNALDREAEERLLPLARERGVAVLVNRPFRQGALIDAVKRHPLPAWAGEIDCASWAALLLKFIVSHPAVTCAIPATSNVEHVRENLGASYGRLPDEAMRRRIAAHVASL